MTKKISFILALILLITAAVLLIPRKLSGNKIEAEAEVKSIHPAGQKPRKNWEEYCKQICRKEVYSYKSVFRS